jgi:hypothetical protein
LEQRVGAAIPEAQPGDAVPVGGGDRVVYGGEGFRGADRVVAESLDAEQASVGGEADLPQRGQVGQPFRDTEVAGVVDRGLGTQRRAFLVVLLDRGVFVVDVETRGDALGDDPGAKPARGRPRPPGLESAIEDQPDPVRAPGVEVVADDVFENTRPDTGLSSTWVKESSACRIETS